MAEATKPEWMSPREVADAMGVSVKTVYRWIETKRLKSYRPGGNGHYRILRSDAEAYLRGEGAGALAAVNSVPQNVP